MSVQKFQPYSVYYDAPVKQTPDSIPIIGLHYFDEGLALPILYHTPEELEAQEQRRAADAEKVRNYRGPTAEDLDRKCTEMHEANEAYRRSHGLN